MKSRVGDAGVGQQIGTCGTVDTRDDGLHGTLVDDRTVAGLAGPNRGQSEIVVEPPLATEQSVRACRIDVFGAFPDIIPEEDIFRIVFAIVIALVEREDVVVCEDPVALEIESEILMVGNDIIADLGAGAHHADPVVVGVDGIECDQVPGGCRQWRFFFRAGLVVDGNGPSPVGVDSIVAQEDAVGTKEQNPGFAAVGDHRRVDPDIAAVLGFPSCCLGTDRSNSNQSKPGGSDRLDRLGAPLNGNIFNLDVVVAFDADAQNPTGREDSRGPRGAISAQSNAGALQADVLGIVARGNLQNVPRGQLACGIANGSPGRARVDGTSCRRVVIAIGCDVKYGPGAGPSLEVNGRRRAHGARGGHFVVAQIRHCGVGSAVARRASRDIGLGALGRSGSAFQ